MRIGATMVVDHELTKGGYIAHIARRIFHMSTCLLPWIIYKIIFFCEQSFHVSSLAILCVCTVAMVIVELIRLSYGWYSWGMRTYESKRPSAFFWGWLGIALVMLCVPGSVYAGQKYAYPIIWCFAFMDPVMGELRKYSVSTWLVFIVGLLIGCYCMVCGEYMVRYTIMVGFGLCLLLLLLLNGHPGHG